MRLDKYLADAGIGTRSEVKAAIKKKLVSVNAEIINDPGMSVNDADTIYYKGNPVNKAVNRYYMMNKPAGCVCATKDREQTVLDYMQAEDARQVFPVGRLDKDTEGFLLLTDDGMFSHNLMSPRKHVDKTYYFQGEGILQENAVLQIAEGIDIGDDKPTKPAVLEIIDEDREKRSISGNLTIHEGRYHQVKRMLARMGVSITYLKRLSIGEVELDPDLKAGEYRMLTNEEVMLLSKGRNKS